VALRKNVVIYLNNLFTTDHTPEDSVVHVDNPIWPNSKSGHKFHRFQQVRDKIPVHMFLFCFCYWTKYAPNFTTFDKKAEVNQQPPIQDEAIQTVLGMNQKHILPGPRFLVFSASSLPQSFSFLPISLLPTSLHFALIPLSEIGRAWSERAEEGGQN
jgi:quinol-cytochrome oxidoreductase complex cytochrome b subunit